MATSKESELLKSLFTSISTNNPSPDSNNLWLERALYETVTNVAAECPEVTYEDRNTTDNGRIPYKWILPARSSKRHVMLFMHGGGFSFGSTDSHRKLAAHLASACGIPAASVEYKLTPEFQHPRQIDDCIRVYEHLLSAGYHPENIALCGDSCGGGLVSTVPLALGRQALPKPGASVALSPWFDHTASGETHQTNADVDAIKFGNDLAARYTGGKISDEDPLVSALFASEDEMKTALPPHYISVAGHDTLRADGERMAAKLEKAGVEVALDVAEGMQHVFEFMAGRAPEADESIRKIGEWVKKTLSI